MPTRGRNRPTRRSRHTERSWQSRSKTGVDRMRWSYRRPSTLICAINAVLVLYALYGLLVIPRNVQRSHSMPAITPAWEVTPLAVRYTPAERERVIQAAAARTALEAFDLMQRVKELQLESAPQGVGRKNAEWVDVAETPALLPVSNHTGEGRASANDTDQSPGPADVNATGAAETSLERLDGGKLVLDGPEVEDGIIPGRPVPEECHAEPHTDYDGVAVRWGPTHPKESAADCCQACLDQARKAKPEEKKCNIWVYCPAEEGCFSPDIYVHKQFECWLKQSDEPPKINYKGRYSPECQRDHPNCPQVVAWASGVISAA